MTDDEVPDEMRTALREALLDEDYRSERRRYLTTMVNLLGSVATWLAVDSWLGGGKVVETDSDASRNEAFAEFRAAATVVTMAFELADGAVQCVERDRVYASAALTRQLLECEYLLSIFNDDLDHARRWREGTPDELRREFTPARMRRIGGFDNGEYGRHCDLGGHPNPTAQRLLEYLDPRRLIWPLSREELVVDLGLHLDRTWRAVDRLLVGHHVRFAVVRAIDRRAAQNAWTEWLAADPVPSVFVGGVDRNA